MTGENIQKEYLELVLNNQDMYIGDYQDTIGKVAGSTAIYKGKPVPFLYNPMFFTTEEEEDFKWIGSMMMEIGERITDMFIEDPEFRRKFDFPDVVERLILKDNGYGIHVPVGRFDIFYKDRENFKFCELNTDGSSAMNEDNTLGRILMDSRAVREFSRKYTFRNPELIRSWVDESLGIYQKWDRSYKKPNVAIVDFVESGTSEEFKLFQKTYEEAGFNCIIADPRDLVYKDRCLMHKDYKIDMIYRRIVTFELIEKYSQIPDLIEAFMDDAVCVIGTIRSQVIHNKVFFEVLHQEDTLVRLTDEQRKFVKAHIPYTASFGGNPKVFEEVSKNRDRYIMKPMDLNASQGVFAGRDLSQEEWERRLLKVFDTDYLFQEYVLPYQRDYAVFKDGKFQRETLGSIIGIFMYNRQYRGLYTRLGAESIISGVTEYYSVPNFIASKK